MNADRAARPRAFESESWAEKQASSLQRTFLTLFFPLLHSNDPGTLRMSANEEESALGASSNPEINEISPSPLVPKLDLQTDARDIHHSLVQSTEPVDLVVAREANGESSERCLGARESEKIERGGGDAGQSEGRVDDWILLGENVGDVKLE